MMDTTYTMDAGRAGQFARIALAHVRREYPNKLDHIMFGDSDVQSPSSLHPIFYGSFDWHSCVHAYWLLARLLRRFPGLPQAAEVRALFDEQFTPEKVEAEREYAANAGRGTFERPYGWAWLLMLAGELSLHAPRQVHWARVLGPLTAVFAERFKTFLPRSTYPIRTGTHFNTAFALTLAADYASHAGDAELMSLCSNTARRWYGEDRDCQAWEPGGDDFLSSALMEAHCMSVVDAENFRGWFDRFLPLFDRAKPATLFVPAHVSDRTDAKIAHLDGLNLSRAWCFRRIARTLKSDDPRSRIANEASERHLHASLPHLEADYAGEHWLATFALLALDEV